VRPLRGILPPVITPFDSDGALDLAAFEANLEAWAAEDLEGYVVLGSNGEAASLEEDEKLALVRAARARAGSRAVLVGTGLDSTRATVALTRRVADLGADAVLVLTPHYYKPQMTAEALRRHYLAVAEASPVPVYLYSMTLFTGVPWPPGLAADLASHPRIVGIKESSSDLGLLGRIITSVPARFEVACGSAPVLYPALCLGACAGVLAVANCAPGLASAVYRAFEAGDHARARKLQAALTPLAVAVTATYGIAGLKAAVDAAGLKGGQVRAPLMPLGAAAREDIRALLVAANESWRA
jgi:4-hydroxy-2-oxoglutarate aldolase